MLNEPVPDKMFIWKIAGDGRSAVLDLPKSRLKQVRVDLVPMLGRLATAPPDDQAVPGGVPSTFGGNMDTSEAREGTTVYLPVYHEGAGFYYGDVHALQGDGEVIGSGIETSADVAFEFGLLKKKTIAWPRLENEDFIMVAGSARPLIDAFRIAHVEMVKWLESEYGFDRWEGPPGPVPGGDGPGRQRRRSELHGRRPVPQALPARKGIMGIRSSLP